MPTAHFFYDFIFIPKTIDGKKTFNREMMESPSIKQGGKAAKRSLASLEPSTLSN